jgi:hypothetical protein
MAMIATTTSSSINVKAENLDAFLELIGNIPPKQKPLPEQQHHPIHPSHHLPSGSAPTRTTTRFVTGF